MPHAGPTDGPRLIARLRAGDEAAARALWSLHAPRLTAYARAILARHDPAGAQDIVQQAFHAALRAPAREARAVDDPGAWLLRITRNLALNRLRSLKRERQRLNNIAPTRPDQSPAPIEHDALSAALDNLPRPLREVVTLKHAADLTFDQMAAVLGANRSTLATRYQRAIDLLRAALDPAPTPPSRELTHARL
jgi:RNA polymerase sigma-70 factor (ECF subfamily)